MTDTHEPYASPTTGQLGAELREKRPDLFEHGDGIPVLEDTDQPVRDIAGAEVDTDEPIADAIIGERITFDIDAPLLEDARARYFTASEHPAVVELRDAIHVLGALIRKNVPAGVQRDLAEQGLELVQMRGNRGIFARPEPR